ncbi:Rv3235 family protein [Brevibacterium sp. R8603A2]|uniref:3-hydroxyacyl-CoA dehydrogenase n=1 Tax=Brevibacterium pityocampae TaxID=506594 RepID=A0ABP8JS20_9MICO|nr:Rv3235 family protein [Brevibacterium sp. R8603A2]MCK1803890.1 Rv3235 family protein [Brevibacterium sp. R8603A2]
MSTPLTITRPAGRSQAVRSPIHRAPQRRRPATPAEQAEFLRTTVQSLAVAVVEVLTGARASSSIARWIAPELQERIRTHAALRQDLARAVAPRGHVFTPGRPRLCMIGDSAVEACVVVRAARRHRAVAMRLEHMHGRWLVTEFVSV